MDGITFDSSKEARRYWELKMMERAGRISDLQRQVTYILIPTHFVYTRDGKTIVEDVKGYRDPASAAYAKFVIKRKLMLERYGIQIQEV